MQLKNKVAIVTGGSKGIGWGIVHVFAQRGAKVVVVARNKNAGMQTVEEVLERGGDAIFVSCDISNEVEVQAMVQETLDAYGQIDILVNNAGVGVYKSVVEATSDDWDRCLNIDLKGVFLCSKYVIPHMQAIGKGAIVNISSVHSQATANGTGPYAAAKGGTTAT